LDRWESNGVVDINDERDFQLNRYDGDYIILTLSGDSFYPIINLKTSSRLRLTPRKFFAQPSSTAAQILSALSTETYFRIEDKALKQTSGGFIYSRRVLCSTR